MKIFVYGSLLKGFGNHSILRDSARVGEGQTLPTYTMINLGAFPGVLDHGKDSIKGEVYVVSAETLAKLDRLEGHPDFYKRTTITLKDGQVVEIYIYQGEPQRQAVVPDGDWREFRLGMVKS